MTSEKIQVLGLCRFSYPATKHAFQAQHTDNDAVRDFLYDAHRLTKRMMWFEHVFLPSVRKQTDQDFTILLLMGEELPEPFLGAVMTLISDIRQIVPIFKPQLRHRLLCKELFLAARDPNADIIVEFRPDDDDAFAIDYVESLRKKMDWVRPCLREHDAVALDFQRGFLLETKGNGVNVRALTVPLWTPALAVYLQPGSDRCIMDCEHHRIFASMPVISDSSRVMFVRGGHDTNDSHINLIRAQMLKLEPDDIIGLLAKRFDIDLEAFESTWDRLRHFRSL